MPITDSELAQILGPTQKLNLAQTNIEYGLRDETTSQPTQREYFESWIKHVFYDPSVPADFWDESEYVDFPPVTLTDDQLPTWERKQQ